MIRKINRITTNRIKCKKCGNIIESTNVHDFKWRSGAFASVDGERNI